MGAAEARGPEARRGGGGGLTLDAPGLAVDCGTHGCPCQASHGARPPLTSPPPLPGGTAGHTGSQSLGVDPTPPDPGHALAQHPSPAPQLRPPTQCPGSDAQLSPPAQRPRSVPPAGADVSFSPCSQVAFFIHLHSHRERLVKRS